MLEELCQWTRKHPVIAGVVCYYAIALPSVFYHNQPQDTITQHVFKEEKLTETNLDHLMLSDTAILELSEEIHTISESIQSATVKGPSPDEPLEYYLDLKLNLMTGQAKFVMEEWDRAEWDH